MAIDKEKLYGEHSKHDRELYTLQRRGIAKALDIPYDEVRDINTTKIEGGGWLKGALLGAALMTGLGGMGLGAASAFGLFDRQPVIVAPDGPDVPGTNVPNWRLRIEGNGHE